MKPELFDIFLRRTVHIKVGRPPIRIWPKWNSPNSTTLGAYVRKMKRLCRGRRR